MSIKRITVFENQDKTAGKVLVLPDTLEELFKQTSEKFNLEVKAVFNERGAEISDIGLIRDDDTLYLSRTSTVGSKNKNSGWIILNVGGKCFATSKSTLTTKEPTSMLARMFAEDQSGFLYTPSNVDNNGAYLIDRSPEYFEPLLNYLRNDQLIYDSSVNPQGILEEAKFFGIESVIPLLEEIITLQNAPKDTLPLTRRDVIDALIRSSYTAELRFQGVNLCGADLSKLDLRYINFKYANLRGCKLVGSNLSWCCFERADLSRANLDGAQLLGVKGLCANMESASLKNCNFKDPAGSRANMEGVNLKGANLEGSDMGSVNLRVATLKDAILKNCDLRMAVLAGADLEVFIIVLPCI